MSDETGHPEFSATPQLPSVSLAENLPAVDLPAVDRLAAQLSTLTEVVETITYRLLELEEALSVQQAGLEALAEREQDNLSPLLEETGERLDDTEERLSRIESVLHPAEVASLVERSGVGPIDAPFPDEQEQPFMDEWPDAKPA